MTRLVVSVGLASALACASFGAWAQTKASDRASQTFITKAIEGNLAEIQLGQLAQQKGASDGVRNFGQQLVADHSAANSASAPPRSTLTRRLTPFSTIVTPNRRCMRLIVTALWVTIR